MEHKQDSEVAEVEQPKVLRFEHRINPMGIFTHGKAIYQMITSLGIQAMIAGGFCRDSYFGREPKDLDIIIPQRFSEKCRQIFCEGNPASGEYFENYAPTQSDRFSGVIKHRSGIDLIFYNMYDVDSAYNYFDCSINQFIISDVENMVMEYKGKTPITKPVLLRPILRQRFEHLQEIILDLKETPEWEVLRRAEGETELEENGMIIKEDYDIQSNEEIML